MDSGVDVNANGVLDAGEVTATSYTCDGLESLVAVSVEASSANCAAGGQKIESGVALLGNRPIRSSDEA